MSIFSVEFTSVKTLLGRSHTRVYYIPRLPHVGMKNTFEREFRAIIVLNTVFLVKNLITNLVLSPRLLTSSNLIINTRRSFLKMLNLVTFFINLIENQFDIPIFNGGDAKRNLLEGCD